MKNYIFVVAITFFMSIATVAAIPTEPVAQGYYTGAYYTGACEKNNSTVF